VSHHDARARGRSRLRARRLPVWSGLAVIAALTAVAPAAAQSSATCRASAARTTVSTQVTSEPIVANPAGGPCTSQSQRGAAAQPVGPLTVADPKATTRIGPGVISAAASVTGVQLGDASGISVGVVEATQTASCTAGSTVTSGA
jgi:ABC-type transport system substrate-binding protein